MSPGESSDPQATIQKEAFSASFKEKEIFKKATLGVDAFFSENVQVGNKGLGHMQSLKRDQQLGEIPHLSMSYWLVSSGWPWHVAQHQGIYIFWQLSSLNGVSRITQTAWFLTSPLP